MATLYPLEGLDPGVNSLAEKAMYGILKNLSDQYTIFHSVMWHAVNSVEMDFVMIHQNCGIIILEVKGGDISFKDGQFYTKPRKGPLPRQPIDPIGQTAGYCQKLHDHLQKSSGTNAFAETFPIIGAIAFPDTPKNKIALPNDLRFPPDVASILMTKEDFEPLNIERIEQQFALIFQQLVGVTPLTADELEKLVDALRPNNSRHETLANLYHRERDLFAELLYDQAKQLSIMRFYSRGAIQGGPGTGKTVLAYEMAARLSEDGQKVLFLCNNITQEQWLLGDMHANLRHFKKQPGFQIRCLKALVQAYIEQSALPQGAKQAAQQAANDCNMNTHDGQQGLADLLRRAIEVTQVSPLPLEQYDAILVDEAQALDRALLEMLPLLLKDPSNGRLYAFYDPAQSLDELDSSWQAGYFKQTFSLTTNLRNSRAVYEFMRKLKPELKDRLFDNRPLNRRLRVISRNFPRSSRRGNDPIARERLEIMKILEQLLGAKGKVRPEDILIITCRPQSTSHLYQNRSLGSYQLLPLADGLREGCVKLSTIRSARGLESDVVILAEIDGLKGGRLPRDFAFNAVSRTCHQLYILGTEQEILDLVPPATPEEPPNEP